VRRGIGGLREEEEGEETEANENKPVEAEEHNNKKSPTRLLTNSFSTEGGDSQKGRHFFFGPNLFAIYSHFPVASHLCRQFPFPNSYSILTQTPPSFPLRILLFRSNVSKPKL
jgi:hypothetical protein